jgi:16S rRNA (guanine527-N7)-methyltransferase
MDTTRSTGGGVPRETRPAATVLFGAGLETAETYAQRLATTGVERGLIGPREVPRLWDRHLLNCVVLGELLPKGAKVADVGTGAGLPGLPLAIARPDVSVSLIEPLLRRVVWLRETVLELGLPNVEIVRARANAVAETHRVFDAVTARAVAPLPALVEWCLPLVRAGGEFLAMKGDSAAEELAAAGPTLVRLGAREWSLAVCGAGVLEIPTTVVRVVAGEPVRPPVASPTAKSSKQPRPRKSARGRSERADRRLGRRSSWG